jgi:hypothetical protein
MPMSPRLLRPRASNNNVASDADARAYIESVRLADGQYMEPAVQLAINDFVVGCKADGIWSAIKTSCILMGARTLSGALVPLVGTAPTNNGPFVSGDYNRETGLVGNGTTKRLDSGRNNNADGQNNHHLSVYVTAAHASGVGSYIGAGGFGTGASTIQYSATGTSTLFRSRTTGGGSPAIAATNPTGFIGLARSDATSYARRMLGSASTSSEVSQTPFNENIEVFDRGRGAPTPSNARLAFYSVGESLDLALLDTRVTNLYNAIGAAI